MDEKRVKEKGRNLVNVEWTVTSNHNLKSIRTNQSVGIFSLIEHIMHPITRIKHKANMGGRLEESIKIRLDL